MNAVKLILQEWLLLWRCRRATQQLIRERLRIELSLLKGAYR